MCLIIYSPTGNLVPQAHFMTGAKDNDDGIGVMSTEGVEKFIGRKRTRRAWRYVRSLADKGLPHAVHFRFATHGRVGNANTHPINIPDSTVYMMHNGVLWTAVTATEEASDTAIFARSVMPIYLDMMQTGQEWKRPLEMEAASNRILLMDIETGSVDLINEHLGDWVAGFWYSNLYSMPWADLPPAYRKTRRASYANAATFYKPTPRAALPSGPTLTATTAGDEEYFYRQAVQKTYNTRRGGFDWHDRRTWDSFPIPGSWDDRFPLAESTSPEQEPDEPTTDDAMDGVQQYI